MTPQERKIAEKVLKDVAIATLQKKIKMYEEVWVSGSQLINTFSFMTKDWVRTYGELLPRIQPTMTDESGVVHKSPYQYPLHELQRMMWNGEMKDLGRKREDAEKASNELHII